MNLVKPLILVLALSIHLCAAEEIESPTPAAHPLNLDGMSFPGKIRAKGILGLFGVRGTLSFNNGLLVWSVQDTKESAAYQVELFGDHVVFTSRVAGPDNTYVDWSGSFNGTAVSDVVAVWTRTEEKDLIHDIFLPDVVTLVFNPSR